MTVSPPPGDGVFPPPGDGVLPPPPGQPSSSAPDPVQAPPPGWVGPGTPGAPRRGRSRLWLVVIAVIVAVIAIGGFQTWQTQQAYDAGHAAYLLADCPTAIGKFEALADGDSDTALMAQAELQECEALVAAAALATGDPAGSVLADSALIEKYPASPLIDAATSHARTLAAEADPEALGTFELCEQLGLLEGQGLVPTAAETFPALLVACGLTYEAQGSYTEALIVLDRLLADYPDHSLASTAQEAFARVTIADATASGAGELPAPNSVGITGDADGPATVVIQNDSPESMSLVFQGPDVRVERLEPCTDCIDYQGAGPAECPELGPVGEYELEPGVYDVVVKASSDAGVTPFRGRWTLEPGGEYFSCFYLVTE